MKIMASNTDVSKIENGTEDSSSFHRNTSFVLLFVQFFGIMPLYGLSGRDERKIRFEWKSLRVLYSLYVALGAFVSGIFVIVHFCLVGVMMDKTGHIAFYFGNFFNVVILMRIARHWSTIVQKFSDVERVMSNYGKLPNLRRRFQIFIISTTFLALLEHSLFIVYQITFALKECKNFNKYPFEIYFAVAFPHFFGWLEFSYWGASLVEIANLWSTVVWNFTDIFLMVVSSGLAIRLKQVMDRLEAGKSLHEAYIVEIRQDYNKMCNLCQTVDSHIAPLVLVSYLNNVYFICVQLYNSIKPRSGIVESVYFFYSFGFILGRLIGVTLCASWLNDESQRPLKVLYSVPSEQYSKEVSRFIDQIASSSLGITGSKFFVVTRSFMLKIAGTIVTIELMLMQFGPLLRSNDPNYSVNTCVK